ncbi:4'-phosphopantetheinyl transferase family protein [Streptacidiphilus griseoplanus]|uniref:4'-phosphopantetheinyl transferase family protein n=1 Tax=Peterkaempfera griseoplana TaxID=66896 RepID=UPI0007C67159|nr:4'-phosphopantetheinyl transferase superfamily protein [Peterkaempfera griseoplana]
MDEYGDMTAGAALLPEAGHRPAAGAVEVGLLHAAAPGEVQAAEHLAGILSAEERKRADAFVRAADRALYLVSHVGLRLLLGAPLGVPPGSLDLRRAPCPLCGALHGRPEVAAEPELHFSLSHAREYAICATAAAPVGADLEAAANAPGVELVPSTLHPEERAALAALPEERQPEAFLHCWVRKEAYLKGLGTGLGTAPDSVRVGLGPQLQQAPEPPLDGWSLAPVTAPRGYAAAVALLHPGPVEVTVRPLSLAAVVESGAVAGLLR